MSADIQTILNTYAAAYVQMMQSVLPSVTGKTKASIRAEVTPNRMRGFARGFIHALETGRGPRESSTYSEYDKSLESWLRAKGFPTKKSKSGITYYQIGQSWFSAKSLAWKINAKGDRTFRSGGKEIYSDKLDALVNELMAAVEKQKVQEYRTSFLNQFKESNGSIGNKAA